MALKPHIGLRYDRLTTSGFRTKDGHGRTLVKTASDTQDIWSVPIGLTFEAGLKTNSGWVVRPQADLSLIFSRGDIDDNSRITVNGVGTYSMETNIVDNQTLSATLGIDMQKGNKSFSLHYNLMNSSNEHDNSLMAHFVYKFE